MDAEALRAQLMPTFREELSDHVATLRDGPAVLADPDRSRGDDGEGLVRAAHTVKGAAGSLGIPLVAAAGGQLERRLVAARANGDADADGLVALLPRAADALEDAGERLSRGEDLEGSALDVLMSEMEAS